ncbi:glypican-5b, partial [Gadus macrocephalus]|uniref:glypican-5b n=1 Tax=Gadus macrocephalus TaxID=80720 RepID=UPI0028CBADCB
MSRPTFQSADLLRFIVLYWMLVAYCCTAHADDCLEVKTAYMMRQIGPVELVPNKPKIGEPLEVCSHAGPSCCNSPMEDSYMTAVRAETQQRIRSYSFELKYLLAGHSRAFQETFLSLASFTSNLTSTLLDSAYSALASDCRPLVARLFQDIELHLSGDAGSSLELAVRRFYDDLFPLVYRRLLNPGIGHTTPPSAHSSTNQDECLRMTRQDVSPFGPHPRLLVGSLSRALEPGRALSRLLGLAGEVVNATDKVALGRECGRGLVRMQYCSHCRGLTLIRPCNGLCVNIMRGCLVGVSELGGPWTSSVLLLQRLAAMLAASSGPNTMELALLSVRSYVNDAILHAQLHGPRITATVEKVCGQQTETHNAASAEPEFLTFGVKSTTSLTSSWAPSPGPETPQHSQPAPRRSLPLKGSRGDKLRSLKKLSREFEGSIQRYQWFFSELPEMLCESEIEVGQHTCWSGRDVVESYTGPVVDGSLKAQRENPEMSVRNTDAGLRGAKKRLEQLIKDLLGELGWASRGRGQQEEEEEDGSGQREAGSGEECDDEDGCEGSAQDNGKTLSHAHAHAH